MFSKIFSWFKKNKDNKIDIDPIDIKVNEYNKKWSENIKNKQNKVIEKFKTAFEEAYTDYIIRCEKANRYIYPWFYINVGEYGITEEEIELFVDKEYELEKYRFNVVIDEDEIYLSIERK